MVVVSRVICKYAYYRVILVTSKYTGNFSRKLRSTSTKLRVSVNYISNSRGFVVTFLEYIVICRYIMIFILGAILALASLCPAFNVPPRVAAVSTRQQLQDSGPLKREGQSSTRISI